MAVLSFAKLNELMISACCVVVDFLLVASAVCLCFNVRAS